MPGWVVPPPKEPTKTKDEFRKEREEKVKWLIRHRYLRSKRIIDAMLKVPREEFIPSDYDYDILIVECSYIFIEDQPFLCRRRANYCRLYNRRFLLR